ncbi:MAG: Na+/H+ antiporter NhaC [Cloacibacillus sp.]
MSESTNKLPSFGSSLLSLVVIVAILMVGILTLHVDLHILLILGLLSTILIAMSQGFSFEKLSGAMAGGVTRGLPAMFIFILIGVLIGSWISAGTVPALMYYGLKLISPAIFLPMAFLLCSLTSLCTGTSWGTAGTMGVAMMGMGMGLGMPASWVAGAVVSGAVFGDKMSPISDTTVLASVTAGAGLYDHIKAMLYTTIPAFIIALALYVVLGLQYASGELNLKDVELITSTLEKTFNLNPLVMIPFFVLLALSLMKVPATAAMFIGALTGSLVGMLFQGLSFAQVLTAMNYGYSHSTNVALVDKILMRGGIQSMMWTFSLSFLALSLGGVLEEAGFLKVLISGVMNRIHSAGALVLTVIVSCTISTAAMAEVYLGIILNGTVYKKCFEDRGLKPAMLSRLTEEGSTCMGSMIPWTTMGAFISGTLGVPTWDYAPFAFLNYLTPLISIIFAYLGMAIFWKGSENKLFSGKTPPVSK